MKTNIITIENIIAFTDYLKTEEKAVATIEKYSRDVAAFSIWLNGLSVMKETAADYKKHLLGIRTAQTRISAKARSFLKT